MKTIYNFFISGSLTIAITLTSNAQPGSLDNTFGSGGKITTDFGSYQGGGYSVAIQSDGKIVVAGEGANGNTNANFALARYNCDGSLDNTLGTAGKITTDFGSYEDRAHSVAIQSDNKIVVAGTVNSLSNGGVNCFALVRYNGDGTLDNAFGSSGKVITAIGSGFSDGNSVAIQSDGKIIVAGVSNNGSNEDFALIRYNSNGSLDNNFGSGGKVITAIGGSHDQSYSVAIQSDDKIVVAGCSDNGTNYYDFALVRYNSDGTLDNTFGSVGKVITTIGSADDFGRSVAIQSDGKIVVAGYSYNGLDNDFALIRYNSNGTLDNTFSGGKITTDFGSSLDEGYSVAILSDGKIVLAGVSDNSSYNDNFALVRYNSDGTLDNTFGYGGKVTTAIGSFDDKGCSVAIQSDDKIVVAGYSSENNALYDNDFAVLRYNNNVITGIENIEYKNSVNFYPNPTTGTFSLSYQITGTEDLQIQVLNIIGEVVYSKGYKKINGKFFKEINLTNVASGIYLVQIKAGENVYQQKLVKE